MNMMNKCAKFHKDSPSDKKVKFNIPSAIFLDIFAFFSEFFMKLSQKMPLYFFYTVVQKSQKWPKIQIEGSCLNLKGTWAAILSRIHYPGAVQPSFYNQTCNPLLFSRRYARTQELPVAVYFGLRKNWLAHVQGS